MAFRRIDADGVLGGRYRLQRSIASGGMAEVWEAHDDILGRRVAVKVLHAHLASDRSFLARFRREAIAAARLAHPNVVATYDTGVDDGVAWIVMELVEGRTLGAVLSDSGSLSPGRAVRIAAQVADALDYAHRLGVIHRDVKPGNILLTDHDRVKVADFGIAKAAIEAAEDASGPSLDLSDLTQSGAIVGTAKYLSPEQVNGEPVDGRSDVYALGVVLYEMLCGQVPFTGETDVAVAVQHATATPRPPHEIRADIPGPLEVVVLRAMAKAPDERYPSAAELHSALLAVDRRPDDPDPTAHPGPSGPLSGVPGPSGPPSGVPGPSGPLSGVPGPGAAPTVVPIAAPTAVPVAARTELPRSQHDTPAVGTPPPGRRKRFRVLPVTVSVVAVLTLTVVGIVFVRSDTGQRLLRPTSEATDTGTQPVTVVSARAFDPPPGSGSEHDDEVANLTDGNSGTSWSTEEYGTAEFGGLKTGVGVVLKLNTAHALKGLGVRSPSRGWSADVYVAGGESPDPPPDGWGQAVATESDINGDVTFDLKAKRGSVVLLWITNLGDDDAVTLDDLRISS